MSKVVFPSSEWVIALKDQLNTSQAYADAAKNWEGDFVFVLEPEKNGPLKEPVRLYIDLWHGQCREAHVEQPQSDKVAAFVMTATYSKWKRVVTAQLDPIQGLMTGQLKLKGNMVMVMKNVKAAKELVEGCTRLDTEFPV